MSTETLKEPTTFETLIGGKELSVTMRDGKTETVKVLQLPIADYPKLLGSLENEEAQIELYCAKPAGWSKELMPASHDAVMEEAERINGDFFSRWAQRRMRKLEALRPGMVEKMFANLQAAVRPGSLPGSPPTSPPAPG
jgi:hypothetical protein